MKRIEKFMVSAAFVLCFAIAAALVIDVCSFVKATGKVIAVEATSVGDYRVTYKFQTDDGEQTACGFVKNAPEIGDTAVIRYERRNPIFIRNDKDFGMAYVAIAMFAVTLVGSIGKALYNREVRLAAEYEASRKRGAM